MKNIETSRLILRPYQETDFAAVHSYASNPENVTYMLFGPNNEEETRAFLSFAMGNTAKDPIINYELAVTLKSTGQLIGGCNLATDDDCGAVGWILHKDHWQQGYGTEIARALLTYGFDVLDMRRIIATCCTENHGSYKLMEKLGMRREATHQDCRKAREEYEREYYDEYQYAILKDEWNVQKEVAYYNALPYRFDDFINVPTLSDGEISLICTSKLPGNPEKKLVPMYCFAICKDGEKIGDINLRIGYSDGLYYGGQIGYAVNEAHRGKNYAVRACKLLIPVAKAHGMTKLLITNNYTNIPSKRVCEKLGAKLVRLVRLPEWTDLYKDGQRYENIYEWDISV